MDFSAEDLAASLTSLDVPAFAAIQPDELASCAWNKRNKLEVAPNVVNFIRRFNHVSFWAVQEILNHATAKKRAEVMAHFIRTAKKLHELNNLHSEFAILSALQSAAVFRLSKTWTTLPRKDKATFDKLLDLFSERDNFGKLREHMNSIALSASASNGGCVPYLGLYLTDLVYVDMAHPHSAGIDSQQRRRLKMNNILRIVSELQSANSPALKLNQRCLNYLKSIRYVRIKHVKPAMPNIVSYRYIDELQKFIEDDNFKLSLKLEPVNQSPSNSDASSKESVGATSASGPSSVMAELNLSPAKQTPSLPLKNKQVFVPGHRKCRSDGANIFLACSAGIPDHDDDMNHTEDSMHNLIDDSLMEEPASKTFDDDLSVDKLSLVDKIQTSDSETSRKSLSLKATKASYEGCVKRKTLIKDGRKPAVASWQRYWLQLWGSTLVFFAPKASLTKGVERKDFRKEPSKCHAVVNWLVIVEKDDEDNLGFQLTDPVGRSVYKFRAPSPDLAQAWIQNLANAIVDPNEKANSPPANLITFE